MYGFIRIAILPISIEFIDFTASNYDCGYTSELKENVKLHLRHYL